MLTLKSSDSQIFQVEAEVASMSLTIKHMVEEGCTAGEIPLPNVDGKTLSKVIEWCRKHVAGFEDKEVKKSWVSNFMELNPEDLLNLMLASNFLEVEELLDVCCDKAADLVRGKTPEQIRNILGIKNDFTPEEEEQMNRDYGWALHQNQN